MTKRLFNNLKNLIVRLDVAFLVAFLLLINVPFLKDSYFPGHDTKQYFELFYFFYNQLFFHHTLAQWMSFEPFGLAASLRQLQGLDIFSYLSMFLGLVLHVQNVLILYKLSVMFDLLIFLFGVYLLSRHLFKGKVVSFFVCLIALHQATSWYYQIYFNLRMFDLLPLTTYTLVLFFEKKRIRYLFMTFLLFCLWLMGSTFYTGAIWEFSFIVLGVVYFFNNRLGWGEIFSSPSGKRWLMFAVILMAAYMCLLHDFKSWFDVELGIRHRSGLLPIGNYLAYGGPSEALPIFFRNALNYTDSNSYLGIIPVFFFFWALFCVRVRKYYAFLVTTVALWALSFQGIFSLLFYFIPGLFFYHHLAWFYGVTQLFFIICAGFGMENFFASPSSRRIKFSALIILVGTFLADAVRLTGESILPFVTEWHTPFIRRWLEETNILFILAPLFILILLTILAAGIEASSRRNQISHLIPSARDKIILLFIFSVVFFDAWKVHSTDYKNFAKSPESYLYTVNVHPVEYQQSRSMQPQEGRQKDAYTLVSQEYGIKYVTVDDFAQFDICKSSFRIDALSKGYYQLMKSHPEENKDLTSVLGCDVPKIRLVSNALYYKDSAKAFKQMLLMPELFSTLVLSSSDPSFANGKINVKKNVEVSGSVTVNNFVDDNLSSDVFAPSGGWLVYADAYTPGWHATVDGNESPVYQAYLAFKAVWVDPGHHNVRFYYLNKPVALSSYIIALIGIIAGGVLIFLLAREIIFQTLSR